MLYCIVIYQPQTSSCREGGLAATTGENRTRWQQEEWYAPKKESEILLYRHLKQYQNTPVHIQFLNNFASQGASSLMWDWVPKPKKHTDHLPNACLELVKVLNHLLLLSNHRFVNKMAQTFLFCFCFPPWNTCIGA